jgi:hypothetical protein
MKINYIVAFIIVLSLCSIAYSGIIIYHTGSVSAVTNTSVIDSSTSAGEYVEPLPIITTTNGPGH